MQIVLLFPNKIKPNEMVSAETLYLKRLKKYKVIMDEYRCINLKKRSMMQYIFFDREPANDPYIMKVDDDDQHMLKICIYMMKWVKM